MSISPETITSVANLSRIELSADELQVLSRQLHRVLEYIDQLSAADVSAIAPTSHILGSGTRLREDQPAESLAPEQALANAPARDGSFFTVPRVIE